MFEGGPARKAALQIDLRTVASCLDREIGGKQSGPLRQAGQMPDRLVFLELHASQPWVKKSQCLELPERNLGWRQAVPLLRVQKPRGKDPRTVRGGIRWQEVGISDVAKRELLPRKQPLHLLDIGADAAGHLAGRVLGGKQEIFQAGRWQAVSREMASVMLFRARNGK